MTTIQLTPEVAKALKMRRDRRRQRTVTEVTAEIRADRKLREQQIASELLKAKSR